MFPPSFTVGILITFYTNDCSTELDNLIKPLDCVLHSSPNTCCNDYMKKLNSSYEYNYCYNSTSNHIIYGFQKSISEPSSTQFKIKCYEDTEKIKYDLNSKIYLSFCLTLIFIYGVVIIFYIYKYKIMKNNYIGTSETAELIGTTKKNQRFYSL